MKQNLLTLDKKTKKNIFSGRCLEIEGLPNLKIEQAFELCKENFDYVGESFTEEAKKIKYGEKKERPIYGEATAEQTKELVEEEISVVPLPWASTKKIN